jgi:CRP-like cAMP-binding protein
VEAQRDFLPLFKNSADAKPVPRGTVLFAQGDPADVLYVVLEGQVEIRINDVAAESVGPGGMVGELALIDRGPRSGSATTITDARVVPIDEKRFLFLVRHTPFFALNVMHVIADRLRRRNARA